MRKVIKKIATVVASVTMIAAMGITAFADESFYSFVGNPNLFNEADQGNNKVGWVPTNEDYVMKAVAGQDGIYEFTSTYVLPSEDTDETKANSKQFKVLKDAEDNAWSYQAAIGMPDSVWADNQTQFNITDSSFHAGEFKVYVRPSDGYVAVVQDGKAMELSVRYHSRDEDPADFVALSRANILAVDSIEKPGEKAYPEAQVKFDDATYAEFQKTVVGLSSSAAPAETIAAPAETTAAPAETQAPTTKAPGTQSNTNAPTTGDAVPAAMLAVLVAAATVAVVAKKKEA